LILGFAEIAVTGIAPEVGHGGWRPYQTRQRWACALAERSLQTVATLAGVDRGWTSCVTCTALELPVKPYERHRMRRNFFLKHFRRRCLNGLEELVADAIVESPELRLTAEGIDEVLDLKGVSQLFTIVVNLMGLTARAQADVDKFRGKPPEPSA
jgi:hypothetical protein